MKRKHLLTLLPTLLMLPLLLFAFQNCAQPFRASETSSVPQDSSANHDDSTNETASLKTIFLFGRAQGIDSISIDSKTGQVESLASTAFPGGQVGWLTLDEKNLFAADTSSGVTRASYSVSTDSGSLTLSSTSNFVSGVVHLNHFYIDGNERFVAADYGKGLITYASSSGILQTVTYASGAKAHSTAYDSKRKLLFVATLGLNKIWIYRVNDLNLVELGSIALTSPRTLVYDEMYEKLYASTEASSQASYIKGFSITDSGMSASASEVASLAMPLIAADLKVNHAQGFVMATAREIGKQAIYALPVKASGEQDNSRSSFSIPLTQVQPRSLEITSDGRYAVVAMNSSSAANVVAFRLEYDQANNFTKYEKIYEEKLATSGYICATSFQQTK